MSDPRQRMLRRSRIMAVASGAAIPLPTAWPSITLALCLLFWLAARQWRDAYEVLRENRVAQLALALYLLFALGVLLGDTSLASGWDMLGKYRKLLYIPILMCVLREAVWRQRALDAFLAALLLTLAASWLQFLNILPAGPPGQEYTVFKSSVTQGILMAFGSYLLLWKGRYAPRRQWLWWLLALLAGANVLINPGRTGYLLLVLLTLVFLFQQWRWRGLAAGILLSAAAIALAWQVSPVFHLRVQQLETHLPAYADCRDTSSSVSRLQFYQRGLSLIAARPLGYGTGAFAQAYRENAADDACPTTSNPHNQYLLIAIQVGLPGLLLWLALLGMAWRLRLRLETPQRQLATAFVLSMAFSSLLNSMLMDFTEGHWFAFFSALLYAPSTRKAP